MPVFVRSGIPRSGAGSPARRCCSVADIARGSVSTTTASRTAVRLLAVMLPNIKPDQPRLQAQSTLSTEPPRNSRPQERPSRPASTRPYLRPGLTWCTFRLRKLVHFRLRLTPIGDERNNLLDYLHAPTPSRTPVRLLMNRDPARFDSLY